MNSTDRARKLKAVRSRIGRSGENLLASSAAEVTVRLVAFGALILLARHLRPADFGTFNALLAYFALALALGGAGLDRLMLRDLAATPEALPSRLATLLSLRLLAALAAAAVTLAAGAAFSSHPLPLYGILAVALVPAGVSASLAAAFQAREQFVVPATASVLAAAAMAAITVGGVALRAGLQTFVWSVVAAEAARALWLIHGAHREGWALRGHFDPALAKAALRGAAPYALLAVLGTIYFRIDLVMLDAMVGGAQVGYYAGAFRIVEALGLIPALVTGVLFPRFALLQRTERSAARDLYLSTSRLLLWLGVLVAGTTVLLSGPLLQLFFGESHEARPPLLWLAAALVLLFLHSANATVLFAGGALRPVVFLSFLTAGSNVALNMLLIPRYFGTGAAAATFASEALSLLVFTPLVCRRLGIGLPEYLRGISPPYLGRRERASLLGLATAPATFERGG